MTLTRRTTALALGLGLAVFLLLLFRWQPDAQLERRWQGFIDAFETRQWSAVNAYLSPDYRDQWGQTRDQLRREATYAFRDFSNLQVRADDVTFGRDGRTAEIQALVRVDASGGPRAEQVRQSVNTVFSPTRFVWKRRSWRPWDWRLVGIENPEMDLPSAYRDLLDSH